VSDFSSTVEVSTLAGDETIWDVDRLEEIAVLLLEEEGEDDIGSKGMVNR